MPIRSGELRTALELALSAGDRALACNRGEFRVRDKGGDLGPVTEADEAASRMIVDGLQAALPGDAILSEEEAPPGEAVSRGKRLWCIDPIDGTKDFIVRNGEWSVLIGLAEQGVPILGVVYQPDAPGGGRIWYASKGMGAWIATTAELRQGLPGKQVRARTRGGGTAPLVIGSRNHPDPESEALAARLGIEKRMIHGSVGIKLALIADGTGDFYINSKGKTSLWDLCAGDALLREAGGKLLVRERPGTPFGPLSYRTDRTQVTEQVFAMGEGWEGAVRSLDAT